MGLTSFSFLCFYAITIFLYYFVFKKSQWFLVLVASIIFFAFGGNTWLIAYPIITSFFCYYFGKKIYTEEKEKKKKIYLIISILSSVGVLVILKYMNFPIYTLNALNLGDWDIFRFMVPIGISFYSLSMLGYVVDIYYGAGQIQENYFRFLAYGIYFPTIISGPFLRYKEVANSLYCIHTFDYKQVTFGMQRIAWGFFKKLIISERVAIVVNTIYNDYTSYGGGYLILGTVMFAIQLYTDFSGCMDIVLGVSESLGIVLPENFNSPFSAKTISEFWRRWHITLGAWMRDYVFYPILRTSFIINLGKKTKKKYGKKIGKKIPTYTGMFILWVVVGFWHGGAWKFIIGSGILHWFYIVTGELLEPIYIQLRAKLKIKETNRAFIFLQKGKVFVLVCMGFVFFRANSLRDAVDIYRISLSSIFSNSFFCGEFLGLGIDLYDWGVVVLSLILMNVVSAIHEKGSVREKIARKNIILRWVIYYSLLFCVILWGCYGPGYSAAEFIYQGF